MIKLDHWNNLSEPVVQKRYSELIDKNIPTSDLRVAVASLEYELDLANMKIDELRKKYESNPTWIGVGDHPT